MGRKRRFLIGMDGCVRRMSQLRTCPPASPADLQAVLVSGATRSRFFARECYRVNKQRHVFSFLPSHQRSLPFLVKTPCTSTIPERSSAHAHIPIHTYHTSSFAKQFNPGDSKNAPWHRRLRQPSATCRPAPGHLLQVGVRIRPLRPRTRRLQLNHHISC